MTPRRGEYGFDAPYVPALMSVGSLPLLFGGLRALSGGDVVGLLTMGGSGLFLLLCAATFVYTTRAGKFVVWDELLDGLGLKGDEQILDVGCGRGAVLLLSAAKLDTGRATGIDLWRAKDQSGNDRDATQKNAQAEGVASRVELHTGDMRELPFEDAAFDVVTSSLAIHNIPDPDGRAKAVREIARVIKPGGTILLADFKFTKDYADTLESAGCERISTKNLGIRFWYGGPWASTKLVTAVKKAGA